MVVVVLLGVGSPEDLAENPQSFTGKYLQQTKKSAA